MQMVKMECDSPHKWEILFQQMEHERKMQSQLMEAPVKQLPAPGGPALDASAASVCSLAQYDPTQEHNKAVTNAEGNQEVSTPASGGNVPMLWGDGSF